MKELFRIPCHVNLTNYCAC